MKFSPFILRVENKREIVCSSLTSLQWNDFQENIKSAFRNLIEDNDSDFADVTLACEDGHQLEAHKVILDGSRPPSAPIGLS